MMRLFKINTIQQCIALLLFCFFPISCEEENTLPVPLPPTNLTANAASDTQINLQWTDNSTNEDGFKIERKTSNDTYSLIATVGADITKFDDKNLKTNEYTYRVYSFNASGKSVTYSNEVSAKVKQKPELTTTAATSITSNSAICGGNVISDGGSNIISKGIVYSKTPNPNYETSFFKNMGSGASSFTGVIENLSPNTKYYFRAFATNGYGTSYGNELDFTTLESVEDQQLDKLVKTWKIVSASLDGVDKTSSYSNFQLVLQGTKGNTIFGYSTLNRPALSPWKSSGAWQFGNAVETQIIRDKSTTDELAMTYSVTETTLRLIFTYYGSGYAARTTEVVKGQWIFNFKL